MAFGKFADGASMFSTTPVENLFMLEFMPNAPGDFVRVYLYGLMQCYHPELAEDVEGVARALNMEPETVLNACRYWEREGLIVRQSDNPPMFVFHSCQEALNARPQIEKDYYENRDFTASLQNLFGADMLLHPKEYTMASDWVEVMKLPQAVVLCMVQHELESSSKKRTLQTIFKHLDKTAIELADHNIRTVEAAEAYLRRDEPVEQCARALMKTFNFRAGVGAGGQVAERMALRAGGRAGGVPQDRQQRQSVLRVSGRHTGQAAHAGRRAHGCGGAAGARAGRFGGIPEAQAHSAGAGAAEPHAYAAGSGAVRGDSAGRLRV